jgi:hypothetical protein
MSWPTINCSSCIMTRSPSASRPQIDLLYQPRMRDEYGAVGGMIIGKGMPAPAPLCPPQILHGLPWDWTQASMIIVFFVVGLLDRFVRYKDSYMLEASVTFKVVTFLRHVRKVPASYLGPDIDYHEWSFSWIFLGFFQENIGLLPQISPRHLPIT